MRRRNLIWFVAAILVSIVALGATEPPDDDVKLNRFASAWNEYVEKLKRWIRGRKEWAAVVDAWRRL